MSAVRYRRLFCVPPAARLFDWLCVSACEDDVKTRNDALTNGHSVTIIYKLFVI